VRVNWYRKIFYFFITFSLAMLSLLLILGLLQWQPALDLLSWGSKGGFLFCLIFLILLLLIGFISAVSIVVYRETLTLTLGNNSGLGEVRISVHGLRNSIKDIAQYFSEIQEIRPEVKIIRGKLYLTLRIKIPVAADVSRIVSELQQKIKIYFQNVLGLNLESIEVIIEDVLVSLKRGK